MRIGHTCMPMLFYTTSFKDYKGKAHKSNSKIDYDYCKDRIGSNCKIYVEKWNITRKVKVRVVR